MGVKKEVLLPHLKSVICLKKWQFGVEPALILDMSVSLKARMAGLQEDNRNLKLSLSKAEGERKQAQERSNNLEKVSRRLCKCSSVSSKPSMSDCGYF